MQSANWRDMIDKIKEKYEELSGASKFIIALTVLLIISNIIINNWSSRTYQDAEQVIDNIISDETREVLMLSKLYDIMDSMLKFAKILFLLFITTIAYYISLFVGEIFGFFKSMAEFLNDIKDDPFFVKVLVIYDIVGIFFDIYIIYTLVTV